MPYFCIGHDSHAKSKGRPVIIPSSTSLSIVVTLIQCVVISSIVTLQLWTIVSVWRLMLLPVLLSVLAVLIRAADCYADATGCVEIRVLLSIAASQTKLGY